MSELENEVIDNEPMDVEVNEVEEVESEQEQPSELAPDSETEHEPNAEEDERRVNQEKVNQVINKKHREAMEAKEEAARLRKQLEQYTQQQQEKAPEILPLPDAFDDDYEAKVKQRDESIQKRAEWEYNQRNAQEKTQQAQQAQQRAQVEQIQQQATTYAERAKTYGITAEELQGAANQVAQAGLSDELALEILADEDGPLFTKHLAANPVEAFELAQMPIAKAVLYLERKVRPKLSELKPKQTSAPKPTTKLKTTVGDAELSKYKHSKGAKFE
ncbi:putative scaffolding protein [Pseudoalteromonas virus vB_PspP-H6/1]|nr:putative scaffolding protein [Pseudoalteromonas virus vB_PspP-H6/1]